MLTDILASTLFNGLALHRPQKFLNYEKGRAVKPDRFGGKSLYWRFGFGKSGLNG